MNSQPQTNSPAAANNPQSERSSPAAAGNPQSPRIPQSDPPNPEPQTPNPPPHGRGRPRRLDDVKRREICALVAGGCSTREAARYVRCSYRTIRRELRRDPEFHENLRRSETYAQLSPLRAMQQACATHWRAAAWMLERAYPDRFARRDPAAFGPRQARNLLSEVLDIFYSEITDPFQRSRVEKRLRATFEYLIRDACDTGRTRRQLREAMKFFEEKNRLNDPLLRFGFPTPDYASIFKPKPAAAAGESVRPSAPSAAATKTDAPLPSRPASGANVSSNTARSTVRAAPPAVPPQVPGAPKAQTKHRRKELPLKLRKSDIPGVLEIVKEFSDGLKVAWQHDKAQARPTACPATGTATGAMSQPRTGDGADRSVTSPTSPRANNG